MLRSAKMVSLRSLRVLKHGIAHLRAGSGQQLAEAARREQRQR